MRGSCPLLEEKMKVGQVISDVDELKPNQYSDNTKIQWINDIEKKVYREIIANREGYSGEEPEYSIEDYEKIMLVPDGYAVLYSYYLMAMIDYHNAEINRYNNSMIMFNQAYSDFAGYYYSSHRQLN